MKKLNFKKVTLNTKKKIEEILISVIRPYTKDFKVFDPEVAKFKKGPEISITQGLDQLENLVKEEKKGLLLEVEDYLEKQISRDDIHTNPAKRSALGDIKSLLNFFKQT